MTIRRGRVSAPERSRPDAARPKPQAPVAEPRVQHITAVDGVSLAVHRLGDPEGAAVLLVPGTFSNSRFWLGTRGTGFARALAADGFEAWVLDLRGHGNSQRPATAQHWNIDDWGRHDVPAAVRAIQDEGRQALLVGHSAGGAAVLTALAAHADVRAATRGAVVLATPLPWLQRWRRIAAWTMRFASRHLDAFPARLLRLGPEDELPGVMEQWMDWNIRGHWIGNDGTDYTLVLPGLATPLLLLAGAGDRRYAPPHATRGLYELIASPNATYMIAGTATGFRRDYGHVDLVVSADARTEVWPFLIDWLRRNGG